MVRDPAGDGVLTWMWMAIAVGIASGHRIRRIVHPYDPNGSCRGSGGMYRRRTRAIDHIDFEAHEILDSVGKTPGVPASAAVLEYHCLARDPAALGKCSLERFKSRPLLVQSQDSHTRNLRLASPLDPAIEGVTPGVDAAEPALDNAHKGSRTLQRAPEFLIRAPQEPNANRE